VEITKEKIKAEGYRLSLKEKGKEIARCRIYFLHNDKHKEPFTCVEDLFVDEVERHKGYGKKLQQKVLDESIKSGCYKITANTRKSNEIAHLFYESNGYRLHGDEYRIDLYVIDDIFPL
jgi:GNAT superfamily N-acetyltransferase